MFTFGVFADPHYARKKSDGERFFSASLRKAEELAALFRAAGADFVICLGDFIDINDDGTLPQQELRAIRDAVSGGALPVYPVLGNHDLLQMSRRELASELLYPDERGCYSFSHKGWHFTALDTNVGPDGIPYTGDNLVWDDCRVDESQAEWLKEDLKETEEPVVLLTHGNLDPRDADGALDPHVIKNHGKIRSILTESRKVKLVLQGHYHAGRASVLDGIPYLTPTAVVEHPTDAQALLVTCCEDGSLYWNTKMIHITGEDAR